MYMGFKETATRTLIVKLTKCDNKNCMIENSAVLVNKTEVEIAVTPVNVFYGNDTELSVNDSSYDCGEYKIYIPYDTMAPTG